MPPPFSPTNPMKQFLMMLALTAALLTTSAVATPPPAHAIGQSRNWGYDDSVADQNYNPTLWQRIQLWYYTW